MTEELKPIDVSKYRITETGQVLKNERKEELKDEMKNRISMALKDPILQQGFEIICKENAELKKRNLDTQDAVTMQMYTNRANKEIADKQLTEKDKQIANLEKENAELKEAFGGCSTCKRTCDIGNCCDPRTKNGYLVDKVKVIAERQRLLKENTELKEYNKYLKRKRQGGIQKQYNKVAIIKQQDKQLTKAKDLLAKWVELFKPKLEGFPKTPIQVDTEQFLNSEVAK